MAAPGRQPLAYIPVPLLLRPRIRPHGGRSRPHLSLREGSEQPPRRGADGKGAVSLSLALHDSRSVLAVKGPLRRFAPWTAPGRSEEMAVYEGKRGTDQPVILYLI